MAFYVKHTHDNEMDSRKFKMAMELNGAMSSLVFASAHKAGFKWFETQGAQTAVCLDTTAIVQ